MGRLANDGEFDAVFSGSEMLRTGDGGSAVRKLQRALLDDGYSLPRFGADGDFGSETETAVKGFQRDAGLEDDGLVGEDTIRSLDERISGSSSGTTTPGDGAPSLSKAYKVYLERKGGDRDRVLCDCGDSKDNDCAHYLSDALIRAGYHELDGGIGGKLAICGAGRPIRAREMREWFRDKAAHTHQGEPSDNRYWAVFQLDILENDPDRYWGGHVVIHKHDGRRYNWAGTGDYPGWAIQEHYTW